jgi:PadR family transcriptional regulator PadR
MRRKTGTLLPLELGILGAALDLRRAGTDAFHGYAIARELRDREEARRLTAHGTLYRALDRLETAGLLESSLEEAEIAAGEGRPRRRLYRVTAEGETAFAAAPVPSPAAKPAGVTTQQPGANPA